MIKRLLFLLLGFFAVLICMELVLRVLPVGTGYNYLPVNHENPILRGTPKMPYCFSKCWDFKMAMQTTLNNLGFVSDHDYKNHGKCLAIIGNSFVAADRIQPGGNLHVILNSRLANVCGFSISGAGLPDFLAQAEYWSKEFHPELFFFLVTVGAISNSYGVASGGHHFREINGQIEMVRTDRPKLSAFAAFINKTKIFRYFFGNLLFLENFFKREKTKPNSPQGPDLRLKKQAIDYFLTTLPGKCGVSQERIFFLMDTDRKAIYTKTENTFKDLELFSEVAAQSGFGVINLKKTFTDYYQTTGNRVDFSPADDHWNEVAYRLTADEVEKVIRSKFGFIVDELIKTPTAAYREGFSKEGRDHQHVP
jgi:hypothetical protein